MEKNKNVGKDSSVNLQWEWLCSHFFKLNAGRHPKVCLFFCFFVLFLPIKDEKKRKTSKSSKKSFFDQLMMCGAPVCWSKFTKAWWFVVERVTETKLTVMKKW
jgi:hypothetical protein